MKHLLALIVLCQVVVSLAQIPFEDYDDFDTSNNRNNNNGNNNNNNNNNNNPPANFASCYGGCSASVLREYNPVCGSNQMTYDNRRLLACAQRCGLQVTEISQSTCAPSAGGK
ncbi:hypothetical protein FQR65_LT09944 [Abscondita terminalis]|nr:hypothetical protein FQR65_LT09944 [Abscondita terminalis]